MFLRSKSRLAFVFIIFFYLQTGAASDFSTVKDLDYIGAMRIPVNTFGESSISFANSTFAVDSKNNSIFVVGHQHQQAIAEFGIAGFSKSSSIEELPMALAPKQDFVKVLDKAPTGNTQGINHITGLELINGSLVVNAARYYDGNGDNSHTTLVLKDPSNLKDSEVQGFLELDARHHAAGWMTPIPYTFRDAFQGDYIFGFASNLPINGRNSMGPSAFSVKSSDLLGTKSGNVVNTTTLLDFSTSNQLHPDHYNKLSGNDLWTEVSNAYIGFIVPGTETYAVFGNSGGHSSGIGYKITQDTGTLCGGACPYVASDVYNYFWLWDVKDLIKVRDGLLAPFEAMPYEYGQFELPFEHQDGSEIPSLMSAAYFDNENGMLYFMLGKADKKQSKYENAPLMLAFELLVEERPNSPTGLTIE